MQLDGRMCNFTGKPIRPRDRASVQIYLAQLDETGRLTGDVDIVDACGDIRASGSMDSLLLEYAMNKENKE